MVYWVRMSCATSAAMGSTSFRFLGKVGDASGLFGEGFEDAAGVAGLGLVGVGAEEESDAVDGGAV